MAKQCIFAPDRNKFGYAESIWNRLKGFVDDKVPTSGKFANIVRNLGTDDVRMVNVKNADGKRIFGKNITDVTEIDLGKSIPSNTIVKASTKYGERFYISNKAGVKSTPSRWQIDENSGRLVSNTEWDQINPNVTQMKRYVRDDDGWWREAQAGEEGSFLNIQNPSKRDYGKTEIYRRGIDALEIDGRYQLIDESSQAVNPKRITEKPSRDATVSEKVTKDPSANEVKDLMEQYNIPRNIATSIAGGVVGTMADEDGEYGGAFWGGALGLMLGSPKVRGKIRGAYSKATGKGGGDPYMNMSANLTEQERFLKLREDAKMKGFKGDPTDQDAVEKFMSFQNSIQNEKINGSFTWGSVFNNEYFRSGEGLFKSLSNTGKDLFAVLRGFEGKPRAMYSQFSDLQSRAFGSDNTKQAFSKVQIDFMKGLLDDSRNLTDEQALQSFGNAVRRLITFGGRIEDGQFKFNDNIPAQKAYADPDVRAVDEAILNDSQAVKVFQVTKQFFDTQGEESLNIIQRTLDKELLDLPIPVRDLIGEVRKANLTFKQYKEAYDTQAKKIDQYLSGEYGDPNLKAVHKKQMDRVRALIEDEKRFKDLQGQYFPQKFSQVKEAREKRSWMSRNEADLADRTSDEVEMLWEQHKASQILATNKEKFTALEINEDGMDVNKMIFSNSRKALSHLRRTIEAVPDQTKREILETQLENNINTKDFGGFVNQRADGKYELTTPEMYRNEDMFPNGIFETKNTDIVDRANRSFVSVNLASNADHFDRPRNMILPSQYLETDIETLVKFYSDDMAVRLHAIDNGMYDSNAVRKNWIGPIKQEAKGKFANEQDLNTKLNEVESWIALMQGQRAERKVGMTPADRRRMKTKATNQARNDSFFNSIAKVATASFNYGTTLYSMFTPMVLGPFLTSYKSVLREYKNGFLHPKQFAGELKNFTHEIEKMGVIQKKFESFAPEYKRQYREDLLGDPSSWRRRLADLSDNATNFTANLSIARMAKIDPENLGIARLAVGNMLDISGAEAGMVTMAAFRHIEDLLDAAKKLKKSNTATVGKRTYNQQTLEESFERLGVTEPQHFIKMSLEGDKFKKFNKYMRGTGDISDFDTKFYSQMSEFTNTIIDQYHGRTKLSRPLKWMDNVWGRALSRYSVYAQNFGVQTTANRIYRPIKDWADQYEMADESVPMFKLATAAAMGRDKVFKDVFGSNWEAAYNDFPMEAVHNFYKVFGTLGVGQAMMITRGGVLDVTGMATNEALGNDDYEAWRNVKKNVALGTYADNGESFYISDIFSGDVQGYDLFRAFTGQLGNASRLGFGGRYAQVFTEDLRYTQGGIADMTPVTGLPNDVFERGGKIGQTFRDDITDLPRTIAKETLDFTLLRGTPFGTFSDMRDGLLNGIIKKPKNRNIKYVDPSGSELDVNLYEP